LQETIFELAAKLKTLREEKKEMEERLKAIESEIEETENQLSQEMVNAEIQNFNKDGTTFYLQIKTYASIKPEFKQQVYDWLKANGFESLVYETVNAQRFSAFIKELLEEVDELPSELKDKVNVFEKITVGMRKAGK
jgi:hypothetical protein